MSRREQAARILEQSGLGRLLRGALAWRGLLVLTYHRVGDGSRSGLDRDLWSASVESLDAHMRIVRQHFDVIGPDDLEAARASRRGRFLMITFDDGYRDNFELALPVLRANGLRATFFLATGFLDEPRLAWWDEIAWMVRRTERDPLPGNGWLPGATRLDAPDRLSAIRALTGVYKRLPGGRTAEYLDFLADATGSGRALASEAEGEWLTWEMARGLRDAGMWLGGHTVNHPVLARLTTEEQDWEIGECARRLRAELGIPMTTFAYPVGTRATMNADTRRALERNGVRYAFSFYGGHQPFSRWDPLDIHRIHVGRFASFTRFQAMLTLPQVFARV